MHAAGFMMSQNLKLSKIEIFVLRSKQDAEEFDHQHSHESVVLKLPVKIFIALGDLCLGPSNLPVVEILTFSFF